MNNIIKILIVIYLINSYNNLDAMSEGIIITIPEKFSQNSLPLPPFPIESFTPIETIDNTDIYLNDILVRGIDINSIEYYEYNEFLNRKITTKGFYSYSLFSETDFESFNIGFSPEYSSNQFKMLGKASLNPINFNYYMGLLYSEYRLPFSLSIYGLLNNESLLGKIDLESKGPLHPLLTFSINSNNFYNGYIGLGSNDIKIGVSVVKNNFYPYLKIDKKIMYVPYTFYTELIGEDIRYLTGFTYGLQRKILLSGGVQLNNYDIEPVFYIKENLFFGEREYLLSLNELNFNFGFIKDKFNSIISLNILDFNLYKFSLGISYNQKFSLNNYIHYDLDLREIKVGLMFEYKVGNPLKICY
ncbi:MAG: hypothetical protein JXR64_01955 [Spirochaetales bacterium]|nr:hypothetical protein [Spirochaetales bacterium]